VTEGTNHHSVFARVKSNSSDLSTVQSLNLVHVNRELNRIVLIQNVDLTVAGTSEHVSISDTNGINYTLVEFLWLSDDRSTLPLVKLTSDGARKTSGTIEDKTAVPLVILAELTVYFLEGTILDCDFTVKF